MPAKRYLFLGGALALLGGGLALARPARLRAARVMGVTLGSPPIAGVALTYGPGILPVSVIVDVYDDAGSGGSATIEGWQQFFELPIAGTLSGEYRVTTTATYRMLGMLRTNMREFTGDLASEPPARSTI